MAFRKMSVKEIERWSGTSCKEVPKYLIVDCTWPWHRTIDDVKKYIKNPKPHFKWTYPYFGEHPKTGIPVAYTVIFGSDMASQLYFFLKLGAKYVFQIGSLGSLQNNVNMLDLIIPKECLKFDWISKQFDSSNFVKCDNDLLKVIENSLKELNFENYHIGKTVSVASNWIETDERIKKWRKSGLLGVEQETASIYSVCKALGSKPIGLLRVINRAPLGPSLKTKDKKLEDNRCDKNKEKVIKELIRKTVLLSIEKIEKSN